MQRYYQVKLTDLYRGKLSYRRLDVLIRHLPQDSWTQTVLRDEQQHELRPPSEGPQKFGPWALLNYQMAHLLTLVQHLDYVTLQTNSEQKIDAPEYVQMPGMDRPVRKQSDAAVFYLNQLRAKG